MFSGAQSVIDGHLSQGHYFYGFLDSKLPGTTMTTVFTKVGIDQVCACRSLRWTNCLQVLWNPIFGIIFFSYLGITDGKGPNEIVQKIKADLPTAVTGSWAYRTIVPITCTLSFLSL